MGKEQVNSLKIFISYSRQNIVVADEIVTALENAGFDVLIDRRDLPYGEEWQEELADFIRSSDTIVWLVSPDSVKSKWCNWELGEVSRLNKRLIPVRVVDIQLEDLPQAIGRIHILPNEGIYNTAEYSETLFTAIQRDREWILNHTRLASRAREWESHEYAGALLLRGAALKDAETWKDMHPLSAPQPSQAVLDLILQSRRASTRRLRYIVIGAIFITLLSATLSGFALWQRKVAKTEAQRAESSLTDLRSNLGFMNVKLRMMLTSYVPNEKRTPVIEQIDRVVSSLQQHGSENDSDRRQFAIALKHKADELKASDPTKALELYMEALHKHRELVKSDLNDSKRKHDLSISLIEIGDFHLDRSEYDLALSYFQEATNIRQQLVKLEPTNEDWKRELSASRNRESIVLQKRGDFKVALVKLRASLKSAEQVIKLEPNNIEAIRDLYIAWNLIGNTQQEANNLPEALKAFLKGIIINKNAYVHDSNNLRLKRDLSVSYTNLGDVLFKLNEPIKAIKRYQAGMVLAKELHDINPKHPILITDLASNYVGLGLTLEATEPNTALGYFYQARDLINLVISLGHQVDDDRLKLPDIISKSIKRLEDMSG